MPAAYDAVASVYDGFFDRPVDAWEDDRLARLLLPHVRSLNVLDLGAGTGWVADHLRPGRYTAVDESALMCCRLSGKHPEARVICVPVPSARWRRWLLLQEERADPFDTVTATWSAHELGAIGNLLEDVAHVVKLGGRVILHGQGPRYAHRRHYVMKGRDRRQSFKAFTVPALERAGSGPLWTLEWIRGTGALPDALTRLPGAEWAWRACTVLPPQCHYAFAACWRRTP